MLLHSPSVGSLLAVGGQDKTDRDVSALLHYQPDAGQWVKVADMLTQRSLCTCIVITDKELLVAGGEHNGQLSSMQIAQI